MWTRFLLPFFILTLLLGCSKEASEETIAGVSRPSDGVTSDAPVDSKGKTISYICEGEDATGWSDDDALSLDLEVVRPLPDDLQKIKLKLSVTNAGKESILVDQEYLTGFSLRLTTDLRDESGDSDVAATEVKKMSKPSPESVKRRFTKLDPQKTISRVYDLSQPVRLVSQGHVTTREKAHLGFFYEAEFQYDVPPNTKKLFIDAWYRGVWIMAHRQFEDWFGMAIKERDLWQGRAKSSTIAVEKQ